MKLAKQEEMLTQVVHSIAESAKRKSDALEERNVIAIFSRPEAANLLESSMFFDAMRQIHLGNAMKQAKLTKEDCSTGNNNGKPSATAPIAQRDSDANGSAKPAESGSKEASKGDSCRYTVKNSTEIAWGHEPPTTPGKPRTPVVYYV